MTDLQSFLNWVKEYLNSQLFVNANLIDFYKVLIGRTKALISPKQNHAVGMKKKKMTNGFDQIYQRFVEFIASKFPEVKEFQDELIELYHSDGKHALANHLLFKKRRFD
jgi:predicted nuclease of restriction endonuclease-like RecB superfamily